MTEAIPPTRSAHAAAPLLILASTSPRRGELLAQAGLAFLTVPPGPDGIDEEPRPAELPRAYVERLAREKARAGVEEARQRGLPTLPVLGADTTVAVDGRILGKPADAHDARQILLALSGRTHQVLTAICLSDGARELAAISVSNVRFRTLDEADVSAYIASGEPFDKAGAYGIQGRAALMVSHLEGSYSGVMGLPLYELGELLRAFTGAQPASR